MEACPVPHLDTNALRVVKAATALKDREKVVWLEIHLFAGFSHRKRNGKGCYASAEALGQRIGKKASTVEEIRSDLKALGLLHVKRGQRIGFWFPTLPQHCIPKSNAMDEIEGCRVRLDDHISTTRPKSGEPPEFKRRLESGGPPEIERHPSPSSNSGHPPDYIRGEGEGESEGEYPFPLPPPEGEAVIPRPQRVSNCVSSGSRPPLETWERIPRGDRRTAFEHLVADMPVTTNVTTAMIRVAGCADPHASRAGGPT